MLISLVSIDICEPNIFSNYLIYIFNNYYLEFYNYLLFHLLLSEMRSYVTYN